MTGGAASRPDPGGPLIGVCGGHRCAALWSRDALGSRIQPPAASGYGGPGQQGLWSYRGPAALRESAVASAGGVLIRLECPGACAEAPVVVVAARSPGPETSPPVWIVAADRVGRLELILRWLAQGWQCGMPAPPGQLRAGLRRSRVPSTAPLSLIRTTDRT